MTNHNDATEYPKEVGCETCDDQLCVDCHLNMKWNEGVEATLKHVIEIAEGMERKQSIADYEGHYNRALTELKEQLEGVLEGGE